MKCPSQKTVHSDAHRASKRKGPGSAGKRKPRKPCGKKYPKVRICVPKVARPGNILPTQTHIEYAEILNKNKRPIDGVEFAKLNNDKCRNLIPFSPEWVRDNTTF